MLSNNNGVGRLFFALAVEAIAPAVVATMEAVEVAAEVADDNNKDWMAVVAVAEAATVEMVAVEEAATEERWSGTSGDRGIPKRL